MKSLRIVALNVLFVMSNAFAEVNESTVESVVKNAPCFNNQSIEETLTHKIKTGSQRDLGWQVFKEDDHFEVERAFLINKSMQLRFRWKVNADGRVEAISKRATTVCAKE